MKKTEDREVLKTVVVDVICNKCGKSTEDEAKMNFEFAEIRASWGYHSGKDMEVHLAHLCSSCYDEVVVDWKISPLVEDGEEWL